jgi:hypothetical protein
MDKMWFYAPQGKEKQGPVPEAELQRMIAEGALASTDLAWSEGMAEWAPIGSLSLTEPVSPAVALSTAPASCALPQGLLGWMSFVGIVNIVLGALNCISCIGIFAGVFMIIAGVALMGGKTVLAGINSIDSSLLPFFQKLKTFLLMSGIMYIMVIVSMIIAGIVYFAIFAAAMAGAMNSIK